MDGSAGKNGDAFAKDLLCGSYEKCRTFGEMPTMSQAGKRMQ
jgi:hypothetical protein